MTTSPPASQPAAHRWHVRTGRRTASGVAATVPDAWRSAAAAAVQLIEDNDATTPVELGVDGDEPAQVFAAQNPAGQVDHAATAALLTRFVDALTEQPDTVVRARP